MLGIFQRRHQYTLSELELRREARADVIKQSLPLLTIVLFFVLLALLSLLCLRPWNDLRDLQQQREMTQIKLKKTQKELQRAKQEYYWMTQDPDYFETIARDKNNLSMPGETVIRIEKEPKPVIP